MTPRSHLFVTILGAAALPLLAQTPMPLPNAPHAPADLPWPTDRVLTDAPGDGSIWAMTAAWKAGFDDHGAVFVPFLGSDVPSAPTTFTLRSVRAGDASVAVGDAMPQLDGQRVSFARGDVVERYDLRQAGIEQSFVFANLPNRGELQVEIAVQTALEHRLDGRDHCFVGAAGGTRYGGAIAIDARGERLPIVTAWTGEALRLTVPAAFVQSAELPLVIDPLIGTLWSLPTTTSAVALSSTDLAWDDSLQQFFVTYERAFSLTDHDVYVAWLDASMQPQGLLTIDFTSTCWSRPRVATLEAHDVGCVVAETSTGNVSPFNIAKRRFFGGVAPTTMPVQSLSAIGNIDRTTPDIGGDADPTGPSNFLMVFSYSDTTTGEGGMSGSTFNATGTEIAYAPLNNALGSELRPAVSKHCGAPGSPNAGWSIVYRHEVPGQITGCLMHSFVYRSGQKRTNPAVAVQVGPTTPNAGSDWDVSPPTTGSPANYMCVERRLDTATLLHKLHGHVFTDTGAAVLPSSQLLTSTNNRANPVVTTDGTRFVVANSTEFANNDHDVSVHTWALVGGVLDLHDFAVVSYSGDADVHPAVCAMTGTSHNDYGLAWIHQSGNQWSVQAQRYFGVESGGFTTRTTGCGGLNIFALGSTAIGDQFGIGLSGLGGLPGFLVGPPVTYTLPGCTGCTIGADQILLTGNQVVVTVPVDVGLVGAVLSFQGLQLLAGAGPCLGQFELSDTIDVRVR
ncbi:MAG: hypothetical protein JNK15_10785 [Planctomycetes bacterium]|nr:hypothetical protein [Planctomycetota bacterium]